MNRSRWICCQLGAREHYAVARALHRRGSLAALVTDAWAPPGTAWTMVPGDSGQRLSERYSVALAGAHVKGLTASLVAHEAAWRVRGLHGWPLVIERNRWFQAHAAETVATLIEPGVDVVFAHSYSALEIFRIAKLRGLTTVMGQIDPGPEHFTVSREVAARWPTFGAAPADPGAEYFDRWREECQVADRIIVNSEWSLRMLVKAGIAVDKLSIVPLPFEPEAGSADFVRMYPEKFDEARPLRVLYVGSIATFKGVPSLLEALSEVDDLPFELWMVGPLAATIPEYYRRHPRTRWFGAVSRSGVMEHMRNADVLIFPSHSDGFGMAQVEAQAWRLPIIASHSAGRVVKHGVNGRVLDEISPGAIAAAIRDVIEPGVLAGLSDRSVSTEVSIDSFGDALLETMSTAIR